MTHNTVSERSSSDGWEKMKTEIYQLYIQDARNLDDVVEIMEARHKFKATYGFFEQAEWIETC